MLENMKFKIEQSARILDNDPDSSKKIMQKVASKSSISEIKEVTLKDKTNIIKQEKN